MVPSSSPPPVPPLLCRCRRCCRRCCCRWGFIFFFTFGVVSSTRWARAARRSSSRKNKAGQQLHRVNVDANFDVAFRCQTSLADCHGAAEKEFRRSRRELLRPHRRQFSSMRFMRFLGGASLNGTGALLYFARASSLPADLCRAGRRDAACACVARSLASLRRRGSSIAAACRTTLGAGCCMPAHQPMLAQADGTVRGTPSLLSRGCRALRSPASS
jgi:hypothetical protein